MSTTTSKSARPAADTKAKKPATTAKAKKSAAPKAAPTKPTTGSVPAGANKVEPTVVDAPQAVILGPMMRKKELVDSVVIRSGMKKKDVKPVVETILAVLGEALADNRELKLPPFGHLKVRREKQLSNGRMVVAKVRQSTPPVPGSVPETNKTDTD